MLPDTSIYWTGPDVPEMGIKKGMAINEVITLFMNSYIQQSSQTFNVGGSSTGRDDAIAAVINKVENLSTSDIKHQGTEFTESRMSVSAGKYIGKYMDYSISATPGGSSISINTIDGIEEKPYGVRIIAHGKSGTGKNVVLDTPEPVGMFTTTNDMYPITIETLVRMQTKEGLVDLTNTTVITNPSQSGSFKAYYDVKDRNYSGPYTGNLSEFLNGVEATQQKHGQYQDRLKNTGIGDVGTAVEAISNSVSDITKQIQESKTVEVGLRSESGTTQFKKVTTQGAVSMIAEAVNTLSSSNSNIKDELKAVLNKVDNSGNPSNGGITGTQVESGESLATSLA